MTVVVQYRTTPSAGSMKFLRESLILTSGTVALGSTATSCGSFSVAGSTGANAGYTASTADTAAMSLTACGNPNGNFSYDGGTTWGSDVSYSARTTVIAAGSPIDGSNGGLGSTGATDKVVVLASWFSPAAGPSGCSANNPAVGDCAISFKKDFTVSTGALSAGSNTAVLLYAPNGSITFLNHATSKVRSMPITSGQEQHERRLRPPHRSDRGLRRVDPGHRGLARVRPRNRDHDGMRLTARSPHG